MYKVLITYSSNLYVHHYVEDDLHIDRKLETIAGKSADGGSNGFGKRDIEFSFETKEEAERFFKELEPLKNEITVSIEQIEIK